MDKPNYFTDLSIFTDIEKEAVLPLVSENSILCQIRKRMINLTPEEQVRQLFLYRLINTYNYNLTDIILEAPIHIGRTETRADILIEMGETPFIIIEVKRSKINDGKEQLKSYMSASGAKFGVWTNGKEIEYYFYEREKNNFINPSDIPKKEQTFLIVDNSKKKTSQNTVTPYKNATIFPNHYINPKDKGVALILIFFLGVFGIHKFYLGNNMLGLLSLLFCWTGIPLLLSIIDFFVLLFLSQEEFHNRYNKIIFY